MKKPRVGQQITLSRDVYGTGGLLVAKRGQKGAVVELLPDTQFFIGQLNAKDEFDKFSSPLYIDPIETIELSSWIERLIFKIKTIYTKFVR